MMYRISQPLYETQFPDDDKKKKRKVKMAASKASKAAKKIKRAGERVAKIDNKALSSTGSKKARLEKRANKVFKKGEKQVNKFVANKEIEKSLK